MTSYGEPTMSCVTSCRYNVIATARTFMFVLGKGVLAVSVQFDDMTLCNALAVLWTPQGVLGWPTE